MSSVFIQEEIKREITEDIERCPLCGFAYNDKYLTKGERDWMGYHGRCKKKLKVLIQMKLSNTD